MLVVVYHSAGNMHVCKFFLLFIFIIHQFSMHQEMHNALSKPYIPLNKLTTEIPRCIFR